MFSACWSRCEKIFRRGGGDSGRNRTHDLLITRQSSYHYRSPRLPDGYGWFDSHNSRRYCVDLSINYLFKIITSTKLFNIIKSTQPKSHLSPEQLSRKWSKCHWSNYRRSIYRRSNYRRSIYRRSNYRRSIYRGSNYRRSNYRRSNCRRSNSRRSKYRRSFCRGAIIAEQLSPSSEQLSQEQLSPEHMSYIRCSV